MSQVGRRKFLVAAGALLVAPRAAEAQRAGKMPTVGFLCARPGPSSHTRAFEQGLRELGYVVGRDIVIVYRFMPADAPDPFPGFAADLVRRKVDVVLVGSPIAIRPALDATRRIPLVIAQSDDPVAAGLVPSLARPGGNLTGLSSMAPELTVKQLEFLREIRPGLSSIAVLWNADSRAGQPQLHSLERAATALRLRLQSLPVRSDEQQLAQAFAAASRARAGALVVLPDMAFFDHLTSIVELAARHQLPAIYGEREFTDAGGLLSYGTNYDDLFRRAARYVDKILRGAKPGDLPVEQPIKFDLVINLKTARALGLTLPQSILLRADSVIE